MPVRKRPQKLYTAEEAAELLSCSKTTLFRYLRQGDDTKGREGLWPYFYLNGNKAALRVAEGALVRFQERSQVTA